MPEPELLLLFCRTWIKEDVSAVNEVLGNCWVFAVEPLLNVTTKSPPPSVSAEEFETLLMMFVVGAPGVEKFRPSIPPLTLVAPV